MAQKQINTLSDLAEIDRGLIDAQFKEEIRRVRDDIIDRPFVEKVRTIDIRVSIKPVSGPSGTLEEVTTEVEVSSKIPKVRTREYSMGLTGDGLRYNDLAPDNHKQGTLDEIDAAKPSKDAAPKDKGEAA